MKITSLRVLKMDTGISEMNNSPNLRGRLPGGLGERHTGERMKRCYPPGTRLVLLSMDDPYAPIPSGTKGTVVHVDDAAQIHMR